MSRKIKFRAWDKKNECMIIVLEMRLLFEDNLAVMVEGACDCNDGVLQTHENHKHPIFPEDLALMQFTGLSDSEGKEIYEGDIVRFTYWWFNGNEAESELTGEIVYEPEHMSFALKGIKNKDWLRHIGGDNNEGPDTAAFAFFNFSESDFLVTGNIYEDAVI